MLRHNISNRTIYSFIRHQREIVSERKRTITIDTTTKQTDTRRKES